MASDFSYDTFSNIRSMEDTFSKGSSDEPDMTDEALQQVSLWLITVLDYISMIHVDKDIEEDNLFKALVDAFTKSGILPDFASLDQSSPLRTQYKIAFCKLLGKALCQIKAMGKKLSYPEVRGRSYNLLEPRNGFIPYTEEDIPSTFTQNISWYRGAFNEICRIGGGGYGDVFKAQHKMDGNEYAIKKMRDANTTPWHKTLREVNLLASLNHPNVVRYHNAWTEYERLPPATADQQSLADQHSPAPTSATTTPSDRLAIVQAPLLSKKPEVSDSGDSIVFEKSSESQSSPNKENVAAPPDNSSDDQFSLASIRKVLHSMSVPRYQGLAQMPVVEIYIQMELCGPSLRNWITERDKTLEMDTVSDAYNLVDPTTNLCILEQILKGIAYIHSKKLMHRDIKPNNIFLVPDDTTNSGFVAKLGDFGLARHTTLIDHHFSYHSEICTVYRRRFHGGEDEPCTCKVGTSSYAAPEQWNDTNYTEKCDMFSTGVVFFELYQPFKTQAERGHRLTGLHKNELPYEFVKQWPDEARCIRELVREDAALRPSASELLHTKLFHSCSQVKSTREENLALVKEMSELRETLAHRDAEIARLKQESIQKC